MKRGTPRHPKMADLAGRLKVSQSWAIGLLESLWHWAAEFCPDGAIRYPADVVADALWWPRGDANRLVKALADAKWLDPIPDGWLIHHWPHHCEDSVHRRVATERRLFADGSVPKLRALDSKDRPAAEEYYRRLRAAPVETPRPTRGDSTPTGPQVIDSTSSLGRCGDSTDSPRVPCGVFVGPLPLPLPLPLPEPGPLPLPESARTQSDAETAWNEFLEAYPSHTGVDAGCRWYLIEFERRPDPDAWHSEVMAGLRRHLESAKWRDPETGELDLRFVPSIPRFLGMPDGRDPTRGPMYLDRPPPWKPRRKPGVRSAMEGVV